jgi:hypothetical protein
MLHNSEDAMHFSVTIDHHNKSALHVQKLYQALSQTMRAIFTSSAPPRSHAALPLLLPWLEAVLGFVVPALPSAQPLWPHTCPSLPILPFPQVLSALQLRPEHVFKRCTHVMISAASQPQQAKIHKVY